MTSPVIRLDPADTVVVAREDIAKGTRIDSEGLAALADIPAGHKLATRALRRGDPVLKYATVIGYAGEDLAPGTYLHTHNILVDEIQKDYRFGQDYRPAAVLPQAARETFLGYRYAEKVYHSGLVLMDTPGYDPVAATGQIAGGANLICFTTGRGSCFGSYPAPTIKLASNTPMYNRMKGDMDINCGPVIDGTATLDQMGNAIFRTILDVASGQRTKSEALGVGAEEFAPWPIGVTG